MKRDSRLGDKFPDTQNPKWGDMKASSPRMSEEWVDMEPSDAKMSEKWVDQDPSRGHMSDRWVEQNPSEARMSEKWVDMEQKGRSDPYTMFPSAGDKAEAPMKKITNSKPDNKVSRATQHTEFGSTREI